MNTEEQSKAAKIFLSYSDAEQENFLMTIPALSQDLFLDMIEAELIKQNETQCLSCGNDHNGEHIAWACSAVCEGDIRGD